MKLINKIVKIGATQKNDICSQVKIYRTLEAKVCEYITLFTLLALWLVSAWLVFHADFEMEDSFVGCTIATVASAWLIYASYHPMTSTSPIPIVNKAQVLEFARLHRVFAVEIPCLFLGWLLPVDNELLVLIPSCVIVIFTVIFFLLRIAWLGKKVEVKENEGTLFDRADAYGGVIGMLVCEPLIEHYTHLDLVWCMALGALSGVLIGLLMIFIRHEFKK